MQFSITIILSVFICFSFVYHSGADSLGEECKECNKPCVEEFGACTGLPPTIPEVDETDEGGGGGKCNANDTQIWINDGGEATRPVHSNYCSREWNDGCFLDTDCIESCFQENYGYTSECSACFGVIPACSVSNGCTSVWCVITVVWFVWCLAN